jgi:hypothetical protein
MYITFVVVVVVVWEGCDAAKAPPGLHHGDRAYRQVDSLYRTLYPVTSRLLRLGLARVEVIEMCEQV